MARETPTPEIAVIVPTRNRRTVLARAIQSVLGQTHANFELIVVDDGSEDETPSYLQSLTDPRVRWERFERWRGGNAARNRGVELSRAPILSFLDSDDHYLPDRLQNTLAFFNRRPEVGLRISSYINVRGSRLDRCINPEGELEREEFERYLVGHCLFLGSSGITVRRAMFERVGRFDPTVQRIQDREFLLRAARLFGCASSASIDWIKHRSKDSLSHQPNGQIRAFATLCDRHPIIREKYSDLYIYLLAREVLTLGLRGRINHAFGAMRDIRRGQMLPSNAARLLVAGYMRGKLLRRRWKQEIRDRFGIGGEHDTPGVEIQP